MKSSKRFLALCKGRTKADLSDGMLGLSSGSVSTLLRIPLPLPVPLGLGGGGALLLLGSGRGCRGGLAAENGGRGGVLSGQSKGSAKT